MMNILAVLLFTLLAAFILLLPIAIIFNVKAGMIYREKFAGKIDKLRLGKMLAALGIDIDTYISKERAVDIHEQMTRCTDCTNHKGCDERLEQGDITADNIDFCNNEESLQEISRILK